MRYFIDQSSIEPDDGIAIYHEMLEWAAARADRFCMSLQHGIYDQPADEERLRSFGVSESTERVSRPFRRSEVVVRVTGIPSREFTLELIRKGAPRKATAGDICPVEDLEFFLEDRLLFSSYDYGRDLLFDLTESERYEVARKLENLGAEPEVVLLKWER